MNIITDFFKKYDFSFFILSMIIFTIGVLNLYSATYDGGRVVLQNIYKDQIIKYLFAMFVGVALSFIHPKHFYRFSYATYFINLLLLVAVIFLGSKAMGARRWLVLGALRIQPSEFMKLATIMALGRWFSAKSPEKSMGMKELIIPFLMAAIPALLIIIEPDLGTGILVLLIFIVMAFYRQLRWKTFFILIFLGLVFGSFTYQFGLKDYQKQRILVFMNPHQDAKGSGYNAIQSEIAIGSGQLLGKGFMKSSQASLNFLPENHTDFVFSIFSEEHGLIGSIFLILLFMLLFIRFIWLATVAHNLFDAIVTIGLMSLFFWHTIINMAMVTGLAPIVGLPLPLMSFGGSSLLTFSMCCGIATSISNKRNMF